MEEEQEEEEEEEIAVLAVNSRSLTRRAVLWIFVIDLSKKRLSVLSVLLPPCFFIGSRPETE